MIARTAMITGDTKFGKGELAEQVVEEMPEISLVTWYEMVSGSVEQGRGLDLDALVSASCDENLQNIMEERKVLGEGEGSEKLRMFLFSKGARSAGSS